MRHHTGKSSDQPRRAAAPADAYTADDYVEAAIVLSPQVFEYLEDVDKVAMVVADAVHSWYRYLERAGDEVEPTGAEIRLRDYVDRYADRVESTDLVGSAAAAGPGERFDYDHFLRQVWRRHLSRLEAGQPGARTAGSRHRRGGQPQGGQSHGGQPQGGWARAGQPHRGQPRGGHLRVGRPRGGCDGPGPAGGMGRGRRSRAVGRG